MPGASADASVSPERFAAERAAAWEELESALRRAGDRPEKLGRDGVRRLGDALPRGGRRSGLRAAALPGRAAGRAARGARAAGARDGLLARGPARVAVARSSPAATGGGWPSGPCSCWSRGCCSPAPALAGGAWGAVDPATAAGLIPAEFQAAADPPAEGRDYDPETASAFSFSVMFNNIQVTLIAFAGGITFGVADGLRAVLQRAAAGGDRRARHRRGQRDRVPAADLLARAAGDLVHRRGRDRGPADRVGADPARGAAARDVAAPRGDPRGRDRGGHDPVARPVRVPEGFATGPELPVAVQATLGASLFVLFWSLVYFRGRQSTARALARR